MRRGFQRINAVWGLLAGFLFWCFHLWMIERVFYHGEAYIVGEWAVFAALPILFLGGAVELIRQWKGGRAGTP